MGTSTNRLGTGAHARMLRRICLLSLLLLGLALPKYRVYAGPPVPGTTGGGARSPASPNSVSALADPLQRFQSFDLRGGYVVAGVGMRNRGFGTISIAGIPNNSRVSAAYLYWDILADAEGPSFAQGTLNNQAIIGTRIGTGGDPCWDNSANFAYRADVTTLVTGNGNYSLSGFASGLTNGSDPWSTTSAPMAEGASLVVVYANDSSPQTTVLLYDGDIMTSSGLVSQTIAGFNAPSSIGRALTTFIGADGQAADEPGSTFNGFALPGVGWDGADPQAGTRFSQGNLWDTMTADVSAFVDPGSTSATATVQGGTDCLVWVAQVFSITASNCTDDSDCDGLPNDVERDLTGTDRFNPDTDGDGLLDPWEVTGVTGAGFNLDGDPEIEAARDEVFGPYADTDSGGADSEGRLPSPFPRFVHPPDPLHKDIYVELDWQDCDKGGCPELKVTIYDPCPSPFWNCPIQVPVQIDATHHAPSVDALSDVIGVFSAAPVSNPDSINGINLHILVDEGTEHKPTCDRGASDARQRYFGTEAQRGGDSNILLAKERAFRYIWSGHSTLHDDPSACPTPSGDDLMLQGMGWQALPDYDYTPFGEAGVGGRDILVSLGPIWICPTWNKVPLPGAQWHSACFRDDGPGPLNIPGIFPARVSWPGGDKHFHDPLHMRLGHSETEGVRQLWNRTLMHLLGHSLGLSDEFSVGNDPSVISSGGSALGAASPTSYQSWNGLIYAPAADGSAGSQESFPPDDSAFGSSAASLDRLGIQAPPPPSSLDLDGDGVPDGQDNCLAGVANPDQADLDGDGHGDACDLDIDGDGQDNTADSFPRDTDNDGVDNPRDNDDDADGVRDNQDNCILVANAGQVDTDGDGPGDACDSNDDNDSIPDTVERNEGSNPLSASSAPEYVGVGTTCSDGIDNDLDGQIDGADAGCVDTDGDTLPDSGDNCPNLANYGWRDQDGDGIGDACDPTPLPPNSPPTASAGGPYTVNEGGSVNVTASGSDPEGQTLDFLWDLNGDGTFGGPGQTVTMSAAQLDGPSTQPIAVRAVDTGNLTATATTTVNVLNVAPSVGTISAPSTPVRTTVPISASATFTDPGRRDTHTAVWDWGDGTTSPGTVGEKNGSGTVNGSHAYSAAGRYTLRLTVTDKDGASASTTFQDLVVTASPEVRFSAADYSVSENVGTATITATLNPASTQPVTVNYATSNGTATVNSDYYAASGTLTFNPGETSKTFSVTIREDSLDEPDETVMLALSNPTNALLGSPAGATITIRDNDSQPNVNFSSSSYTTNESVGSANITARLSAASGYTVTVNYATSDGTATAGSDYTAASGTLTFAPGTTSTTISIPILEDGQAEANETIAIGLSSPTNAALGSPSSATLTINANDTLTFSPSSYNVNESAGSATITVRLNATSAQPVTVAYTTSDGTATAGSDYTATSGTLTFNPGETSKTFSVPIFDDAVGEANETVSLTLSSPTNAMLGSPSSATLTILANDTLTFSTSGYSVNENAGSATITVRLSATSSQTVTVAYATSDGTATAGSDYTATSGTLAFAPGTTSKTFSVPILDDALGEANETVSLTLSSPTNATLGSPSSATLTINANDTLTFSTSGYSVNENAGSATITVRLSGPSSQTVTVAYATSNGTATAGSDYTAASGTLAFAPGETSKTFSVPILDDALGEANETVNLTLSGPTNAVLGSPSSATLTINANDTLTFSTSGYSVNENAGSATITVKLNATSSQTVTVAYATSNGTATAGSDYTATSGTLAFAPGTTSKTFSVPILDDTLGEANETVSLTLSSPTNATLGSPSSATLTINANDTLTFSTSGYSVNENAGSATITVKLNATSSQTVTVAYATSNGTATAGSDYTATSGTLTFAPGETSKTFSVPILDDALGEANETVSLTLSSPTNAVLGTPATATLTINANDTLTFSGSSYSVNESTASATITVRLSGPSSQTVTVAYATSGGTATAGSDYTATSGTLTFAPGETSKTFSVPIINDTLKETSETIALALSSPTNAVLGSPSSATLTIVDND